MQPDPQPPMQQYPPMQQPTYPPPGQQQYQQPTQQPTQQPYYPPQGMQQAPYPSGMQPNAGQVYSPMVAPPQQFMTAKLDTVPGVVVQQATLAEMLLQAIGITYTGACKYKILVLPAGIHAAREHGEPSNWRPIRQDLDALPEMIKVKEEFSCLRPMKLHFLQGGGEPYTIIRPSKLGAACGCPPEMTMLEGTTELGKVVEDCSCCGGRCVEACCACTVYTKVLEKSESNLNPKYIVRTSKCCCGRVNNCFGASCWKNDFIIDVLDEQGVLVTTIQKTYAPGGMGALWLAGDVSNYILEFPPHATNAQRALLTAAVFQLEYLHFEKRRRH